MGRPFRRYCFHLAERLGMTLGQLQTNMSCIEITEWMAFDRTNNPEWVKEYDLEVELEKSKTMSIQEKVAAFKAMFGGKK